MTKQNEIYNLINSTNIYNNNYNNNTTSLLKEILIPINNITSSSATPSSPLNKEQSVTIVNSFKSFIESIPQSLLLMCVLVLFILFFILIIIILICLIKKRKRLLQTETIVNNNKIDINKMILQNSNNSKPNKNDFHAIQNNSNLSDYSGGVQNMSLSEIKAKNLKEEIHSIVSGTLNEMTINKSRKMKRKKKGNSSRLNGQKSAKSENSNIPTTKGLDEDNKQQIKNDNIII